MRDSSVRGVTLVLLALTISYSLSRLELTGSITHFLPSQDESELVELSLELVDSSLARRMLLSIGGGPARIRVAAELAEALRSHPEVAWVETGLGTEALRRFYDLYFDRRIYLAYDIPESEVRAAVELEALSEQAIGLRDRLAQPGSMLISKVAPVDPLGLFEGIIKRIGSAQPAYRVGGERLTSLDGQFAIVMLGLRSSPFDTDRQAQLLNDINTEFVRLAAAHGGGFELEQGGANRIAVESEKKVRGDLNFISALSISAVCILFALFFRSLRHLLIAIMIPLGGFAVATAVLLTISRPIHGITLGFGFVLIGVAIDYPIHLMNHHAMAPPGTLPRESVARIRPSLLLSGLTTTIAFIALALSDFPGLREMGVFAAIGVPVALGLTLFSIPSFLGASGAQTPVQISLSQGFSRLIAWLSVRRGLAQALFVGYAAICALGLPQLHWQDDPAYLMPADPALLAENERVRERIAALDGGRFVVALAQDSEAALVLNDRVYGRLQKAVSAGRLDGVLSLHSFIWSKALQRANLAAFRSVPDLTERIDRAFTAQGFRPGAFESFSEAVASPAAPPLEPADFVDTPLARALDSLVELDGRWVAITYLRGVKDAEAIRQALQGLPGVFYLDQQEIVSQVYENYRRSTLRMVALGSLLVFAVLQLRYRNLRRGLLAFLSSALVTLTTCGLFGLIGLPVNVISAISLVVVLGMGVDYGVFTVDGAQDPRRLGATLTSLLVACLTTLFVFGALALTEQPALHSIGLTTGVGIVLALILSPAIFVLAKRD